MAYIVRKGKGKWQRRLLTTLAEAGMSLCTTSLHIRCGVTSAISRCAATNAMKSLAQAGCVRNERRGVWQITAQGQQDYLRHISDPEIDALYRQLDALGAQRRAKSVQPWEDPWLDAQITRLSQRLRTFQAHAAAVIRSMTFSAHTENVNTGLAILQRVEEYRKRYDGMEAALRHEETKGAIDEFGHLSLLGRP